MSPVSRSFLHHREPHMTAMFLFLLLSLAFNIALAWEYRKVSIDLAEAQRHIPKRDDKGRFKRRD